MVIQRGIAVKNGLGGSHTALPDCTNQQQKERGLDDREEGRFSYSCAGADDDSIFTATEIDCGFYNEIEISDAVGDATPGAPSYVDILGLKIRQIGDQVQFEWLSDGNPLNSDFMFFFILLDTDLNSETGRWRGGIGAEVRIGVSSSVNLNRFNAAGDWIGDEEGPPVTFSNGGFVFSIDSEILGSDQFDLYFEASGRSTSGRPGISSRDPCPAFPTRG